MSSIPLKVKKQILDDPFYNKCIHERYRGIERPQERITFEHAWLYAGKQIQEAWAIVPCKESFNIGVSGDEKEFNRFIAIMRADLDDLRARLPKKDWMAERRKLEGKFAKYKEMIKD